MSLIFLSQTHVLFRDSYLKSDWFLFVDTERFIQFNVFQICVYLRFIILHYCLLYPKNINRQLLTYFFTLSVFDLIHFFTFSSIGYELEKIILVFAFLYVKEEFRKW